MNQRTAWIVYSALRLVLFAAPFALLYAIGWPWWLAAVTAALVSVSLSVIFLQKPREVAAESIYEWRHRDRTEDEIVEDEIVEDVSADGNGESVAENRAVNANGDANANGTGSDVAESGADGPTAERRTER